MRTVKLITRADKPDVPTHIAHPNMSVGDNHDASVQVREVTEVPDNVGDEQVLRLFVVTCDASLGKRLSFRFGDLGEGRILR